MAADGVIRIDSSIENAGFIKGTKQLEAAARRTAAQISGIGEKAQIALAKTVNSFAKQNAVYAQQEQKVRALRQQLDKLGNARVETKAYKDAQAEVTRLTKRMDALIERQQDFVAQGRNTNSQTFSNMEYQLEKLRPMLADAIEKRNELVSSGKAYQPADTSRLTEQLAAAEARLADSAGKLETSYASLTQHVTDLRDASTAEETESAYLDSIAESAQVSDQAVVSLIEELEMLKARQAELSAAGLGFGFAEFDNNAKRINEINAALAQYRRNLNGASQATRSFGDSMTAASGSFKQGLKTLMKYGLGIRSTYILFRKLRSALKEGLTELATQDAETKNSIDGLKAALSGLKGSFAAAFAPILNTVAPILIKFINMLADAVTAVGVFFAVLTGKGTYKKAVAGISAVGEAASGAGAAAKEAEKNFSGLDELNIFQNDSSGGGGGGGGGGSGGGMSFEDVPIDFDSPAAVFALKVKDLLFDWDDLTAQQVFEKIIAGLSALAGGVIGFAIGGVPGAIVGTLAGFVLGVIVDNILFDGDTATLNGAELLNMIVYSVTGALGLAIGAVVGGPLGAALGLTIATAITLAINSIEATDATTAGGIKLSAINILDHYKVEYENSGFDSVFAYLWDTIKREFTDAITGAWEDVCEWVDNSWIGDAYRTVCGWIETVASWFNIELNLTNDPDDLLPKLEDLEITTNPYTGNSIGRDKMGNEYQIDKDGTITLRTIPYTGDETPDWLARLYNWITGNAEVPITANVTDVKDSVPRRKRTLANFTSKITEWAEALKSKFKDKKLAFTSSLTTWKENFTSKFKSKIVDFQSRLTTWKEGFTSKFKNKIIEFESKLTSWKDALKNKVVDFQSRLTTWKDTLKNKIVDFQSNLTTWKDNLKNKIVDFQSRLTTWKDALSSKVVDFQSRLTTWRDALSGKSVDFQARFSSWKDALSNKWVNFGANLTTWWDSIKNNSYGLKGWLNFGSNLTTWWDSIKNTAYGVKGWLSFGANLTTWWDSLKNKVLNFAAKITGASRATGGVYSNGRWRPIQQYASGGLPGYGQLFVAREAGPELVGTLGGHTAVMNNNQIVASVSAGVAKAISGLKFYSTSSYAGYLEGIGGALMSAEDRFADIQTSIARIDSLLTTLSSAPIPVMATGAVIPPQATQASSQYSELREIVSELATASQNPPSGTSGGNTYQFVAQLNRRTLFTQVIEEALLQRDISGVNPFELNR